MSNANMSVGSPSAMPMGMDNEVAGSGADAKGGAMSSQTQSMLGKLMDGAWADGTFDKNDLAAMQAVLGGGAAAPQQAETPKAAAPKDNLSSFIDKAIKDGKIDDNEQAGMNALLAAKGGNKPAASGGQGAPVAGGGKEAPAAAGGKEAPAAAGGSESPAGKPAQEAKAPKDTAGDAKFLSDVNELSRSGDEEGGKMLREQANRLLAGGGSAEDKKAFLDEANKLKSNDKKDGFLGIGSYGGSINESKDNEGTMMKDLTTALLRGKDGEAADGKSDAKSDGQSQGASAAPKNANELVGSFIDKAYADGKLSDTELAGLQALLKSAGAAESGPASTASSDKPEAAQAETTTAKPYSYGDLARGNLDRDFELGLVNDDSYQKSMKYLSEV